MEIFGPIPSRRLGRSLGINNIPPKACSYYCTYCQVGPTEETEINLRHFYGADKIVKLVKARVAQLKEQGDTVDHLSFVPEGEPTLDADLGETIEKLRHLGIKIAVITNGSLIWRKEVRETLKKADWVSLKIDTVDEKIWHRINIPHRNLKLTAILEGMITFAKEYSGTLVTETMLVKSRNVSDEAVIGIADFIQRINPEKAYFLIPTRPPAISSIHPPDEDELNRIYQIVSQRIPFMEYLTGYEGNAFASSGDAAKDLLSITAVHPMREEAVRELLAKNQADWLIVENLLSEGKMIKTEYEGKMFYIRQSKS
ncbi:MAG: radical SAM protein [Thiomargarita sp.]|nr:radical SAM protein [Thiomargarita sp.]